MARKKVETNIYYDDVKKVFYVNMDYGKGKEGKRHQEQKTFRAKKEAKLALVKFQASRPSAVTPCRQTLADDCIRQRILIENSKENLVLYIVSRAVQMPFPVL